MIYLYWYLGIGVAVLAVVYTAHQLSKDKALESLHARLAEFHPDRKKLSYRILNNIVAPALTLISIAVLWPVAVFTQVKMLFANPSSNKSLERRDFAVDREHLQDRLTVQDIEQREMIIDPLDAVPELPFGHLNKAWTDFLKTYTEGDELWSFSARWQPKWGRPEIRSGYVINHDGLLGAHFLTVRKEILDDSDGKISRVELDSMPGWLRRDAD